MIASPPPVLPLLADIDAGHLTPEAAFEAYAERIARHEAAIHAFAHLDLAAARARLPGAAKGALRGLPVGIKDIVDTVDMPTRYGSPLYAGHRPGADAAIVVMTRRAGGSIVGKTETTAFANLDPAPTENPRAPGHTPGGSSSGSAAAVAAGMVAFAVGTQTGGSVVRPASYCGIAGYKPSYRLLPTTGVKTYSWHLDTVGLFAPTVADVAFYAEALTHRPLRVDRAIPAAPRIGLLAVPDWSLAEPAMAEAVHRAVKAAERAGASVTDLGADAVLLEAWQDHHILQNAEGALALASEMERFGDRMPPLIRADLEAGAKIGHAAYDAARALASRARKATQRLFETVDVIVMPAAPGAPPATLASTGRALFNRLWTLTGDPAVAVPGLSDAAGLPLGLQVIGPFGQDAKALAAASFMAGVIARM